MNNHFTKFFAGLLFFTCIGLVSNAQNIDFIVTTQGDTLAGQIIREGLSSFRFKSQTDTKFKKYTADQVQFYRRDKKEYFSRMLPGAVKSMFVLRLEHGAIDLFEYYKGGSYTNFSTGVTTSNTVQKWYASKHNGPIIELKVNLMAITPRKERKEAFEALISDNAELLAQYKATHSFSFETLQTFIRLYNNNKVAPAAKAE